MSSYTLSTTLTQPYDATLDAVRAGLAEQGFGVLSETDLAATLHAKLGVTVSPQVILGACRPQLAHEALQADPSIATVLPCNVVVGSLGETTTVVEVFDPRAMLALSGTGSESPLATVADDARRRLSAMLADLG